MKVSFGYMLFLPMILFTMVSCGEATDISQLFSISSSPTLSEAIEAYDEVMPLVDNEPAPGCTCDWSVISCVCPCSGDGQVEMVVTEDMYLFTMTFDGCVTSDAQSFEGTMTGTVDETPDSGGFDSSLDNRSIVYDFTQFGDCTDLSGTVIVTFNDAEGADVCSGTLTATCNDQAASCDMLEDCSSCL